MEVAAAIINIVLFVFGTIGLTHIIVDSAIMQKPRDWLRAILPTYIFQVFECYQCCGTWVGFLCGWLCFGLGFKEIFLGGMAGSFLAYLSAALLTCLEANSIVDAPKEEK
jgi:hypothetical protein